MLEYNEGYLLQDDEYLFKRRGFSYYGDELDSGFLTKFNQNGTIPKAFIGWGKFYKDGQVVDNDQIFVFTEVFAPGWKLNNWRIGKSQEWASMIHPGGFTVEIYLDSFLELVKENTIINGELQGEFKWKDKKLIKKL